MGAFCGVHECAFTNTLDHAWTPTPIGDVLAPPQVICFIRACMINRIGFDRLHEVVEYTLVTGFVCDI